MKNKALISVTNIGDNNIIKLSYTSTTNLSIRVMTVSGDDFEIDWGDGVWNRFQSDFVERPKNFQSPTAGITRIRPINGKPKKDIDLLFSTVGAWSFDLSELKEVKRYILFSGSDMNLTGDIKNLANISERLHFSGSMMMLYYSTENWTRIATNQIYVRPSGLNQADISKLLVDLDASGDIGSSTLDFIGSNASPNASGISAADNLRIKGYTVLTN